MTNGTSLHTSDTVPDPRSDQPRGAPVDREQLDARAFGHGAEEIGRRDGGLRACEKFEHAREEGGYRANVSFDLDRFGRALEDRVVKGEHDSRSNGAG